MGNGEILEMIAFILYLVLVMGIGVFFFIKGRKQTGDKAYFLGGRQMNGFVAALSAGASDMSAWVLMGLPGSILHMVWDRSGFPLDYSSEHCLHGYSWHRDFEECPFWQMTRLRFRSF